MWICCRIIIKHLLKPSKVSVMISLQKGYEEKIGVGKLDVYMEKLINL